MRKQLIWAAAGGLLVLGAMLLYKFLSPKTNDPPILVGDGSMVISSFVPLDSILTITSANEIILKKAGKKIHKVKHTGSVKDQDCQGKGCTVKTTWSKGLYSLEVSDTDGFKIKSKNADFNKWDTTSDPYIWRFSLPSDATNDGLNVTPVGSPGTSFCSGNGCMARIDYK